MKVSNLLLGGMLLAASLLIVVDAAGTAAWRNRTIYQILTDRFARTDGSTQQCSNLGNYCGGSYRGIMNNLNYIQNLGFDAIWISPIVENTDGGYHGYWAKNIYQINTNFGSEDDLRALIEACHARGIWVMVDVVGNHMGPVGTDYSSLTPFNKAEHYHDYCIIQADDFLHNQWRVENCRLADLPDLKQENDYVKTTLLAWIKDFIAKWSFDGLRIDTIPEVPKDFWLQFNINSGAYTLGEVFDGRYDYVGGYQGPIDGILNYNLYFTMKNTLVYGNSMYAYRDHYANMAKYYKDQTVLGNFADNHDNARILHLTGNKNRLKSALTMSLFSVGIPIVYYGDEQAYAGGDDPQNREVLWTTLNPNTDMYKFVAAVVKARKQYAVWNEEQLERYVDDNFYAFTRGKVLVALSNTDNTISRHITFHPYVEGTVLCNVLNSADCVTVKNNSFDVSLTGCEPKIYAPKQSDTIQNKIKQSIA